MLLSVILRLLLIGTKWKASHIFHVRHVPLSDTLVKLSEVVEHVSHVLNAGNVPITHRLIKISCVIKLLSFNVLLFNEFLPHA